MTHNNLFTTFTLVASDPAAKLQQREIFRAPSNTYAGFIFHSASAFATSSGELYFWFDSFDPDRDVVNGYGYIKTSDDGTKHTDYQRDGGDIFPRNSPHNSETVFYTDQFISPTVLKEAKGLKFFTQIASDPTYWVEGDELIDGALLNNLALSFGPFAASNNATQKYTAVVRARVDIKIGAGGAMVWIKAVTCSFPPRVPAFSASSALRPTMTSVVVWTLVITLSWTFVIGALS